MPSTQFAFLCELIQLFCCDTVNVFGQIKLEPDRQTEKGGKKIIELTTVQICFISNNR